MNGSQPEFCRTPWVETHLCSPEATKGPGSSPALLLVCLRKLPTWGWGLWGRLHSLGRALKPRQEVLLPPGMHEEVLPNRHPEEWAKPRASREQHVASATGMAPPASPGPGKWGSWGTEPIWTAGSRGQMAQPLCPALAETGH